MSFNYDLLNFKYFNYNDLEIANKKFGQKFENTEQLKEYLKINQPGEVTEEIADLIRGYYISTKMLQPYDYSLDFLLGQDFKSMAVYLNLNQEDSNYNYNVIRTLQFAGFLYEMDNLTIIHNEFKNFIAMNETQLQKWAEYMRIPYTHLNKSQIFNMIMSKNFIADKIDKIIEHSDPEYKNINQSRFIKIHNKLFMNNSPTYKDLTIQNNPHLRLARDQDHHDLVPIILIRKYQKSHISYYLIPISDNVIRYKQSINLNNALYVNDNNELVYGNYFTKNLVQPTLNVQQIEYLVTNGKLKYKDSSNNMYDMVIINHDNVSANIYPIFLAEPGKYSFYVDSSPQSYTTFITQLNNINNQPRYLKGQNYFRELREYMIKNPAGLVLNSENTPISSGYPSELALTIFRLYKNDRSDDTIFVWITPIFRIEAYDSKAMVYNPDGYPIILDDILGPNLSIEEVNYLRSNKIYMRVDISQKIGTYYYWINNADFLDGNFPIPIPVQSLNTLIIENTQSITKYQISQQTSLESDLSDIE